MAVYDYQGSAAQKYILFVTTLVVTTTPGENFYAVEIFIDNADAAANFVSAPALDSVTQITAQNYKSLLQGSMLAWMTGFYALSANQVSKVYFVTFNNAGWASGSTAVDLGSTYAAFSQYGYFKLIYSSTYKQKANIQLAGLCAGDPLSQFLFGSNDNSFLTGAAGTEAGWFKTATLDVPFIYHWDTTKNPALVQLGATLAVANLTGTPVGNKLDWLAIGTFSPSGSSVASGIANFTPVQINYAQASGIAFFTYVGDGSGRVIAEGGSGNNGAWVSMIADNTIWQANWMVNYIDTVASITVTTYLTATPQSGFKNNDTYQGVLGLLKVQLNRFSGIGRLLNLTITAPPFNLLPPASGGAITVPKAWSALYADNVRQVTVYGTLTIAA